MSNHDFSKDVSIDKYNLTDELVEQAQLYYEWASQQAEAACDVEDAKDKLDLIKSQVELRIRKNPKLHRLSEKPTESMVKAAVKLHSKVKRANKRYLEAVRIESLLKKAERAFEHRKKALEGLVSLNMQYWYSNPKTNSQVKQEVDQTSLLRQKREKDKWRNIRRRRHGTK